MNAPRILLAACAAIALSACASTEQSAEAADRDCFPTANISGYSIIDDHHVNVRVGASRDYIMTLDWNAHDLDWSHAIAVRSTSSFVCTGNGLGTRIIGGDPPRDYYVTQIARAPAEPAAQGS
jgi:hypothetical protein